MNKIMQHGMYSGNSVNPKNSAQARTLEETLYKVHNCKHSDNGYSPKTMEIH
jgi:hypothetical protein